MLPYTLVSKLALVAAGVALAASGGFVLYNHIWDKGYDQAQAEYAEKERVALLEYAKKIVAGGQQHEKDIRTINKLNADLKRVRVTFPVCPSADSDPENPDGGGRLLSDRVGDAFGKLQEGVGELIQRCELLNADARRMNSTTSPE